MRELVSNSTFVRLFGGRIVTDAGDSLYYVATLWLLWELTNSSLLTGVGVALVRLPDLLGVFAGLFVDRWPLRWVLVWTQICNAVGVLVIPALSLFGRPPVGVVLAVIVVLYTVNGFVYTAQNAALPRVVTERSLPSANSLFATTIRTVDAVTTGVAGLLIGVLGPYGLYLVDSLSFVVAAICFRGVSLPEADTESRSVSSLTDYRHSLREGVDYVRGSAIVPLLVGLAVSNVGALAVAAILPAFAASVGGSSAYGVLLAATGLGGLLGSACASVVDSVALGHLAVGSQLVSGSLTVAAVLVPGLAPTAVLLCASALPAGAFLVCFVSVVQSVAPDSVLGRVSALVRTCLSGAGPLGSVAGGVVATQSSPSTALLGVGVLSIAVGGGFLLQPTVRRLPPTDQCAPQHLVQSSERDSLERQ